jgi:hypothetical protein
LYFDFDLNDDQHDNHHRSRDGHEEIKRVPTGYFYPIFCAANRTTRKAKKEPQRKEEKQRKRETVILPENESPPPSLALPFAPARY